MLASLAVITVQQAQKYHVTLDHSTSGQRIIVINDILNLA